MNVWIEVRDGDDRARGLYRRHYSARHYRDGRNPRLFVGPGAKIVLLTKWANALFVWRLFREIGREKPRGINCAIFRNESRMLSSDLILEAEEFARQRWPDEQLFYTYVNPDRVRSSNPGYCFQMAGWCKTRVTQGGLICLEKETT